MNNGITTFGLSAHEGGEWKRSVHAVLVGGCWRLTVLGLFRAHTHTLVSGTTPQEAFAAACALALGAP